MVFLVQQETRMQAWMRGAQIVATEDHPSIMLEIVNPLAEPDEDVGLADFVDDYCADKGMHSMHTVAEYIFPGWEYAHHGYDTMVQNYLKAYPMVRKTNPGHWGTYAHRMLRVEDEAGNFIHRKDGVPISPLGEVIERMRGTIDGTGEKSVNGYEINMWRPWRDRAHRGLPCLTHLSFKLIEETVHLNAMYRNHDYAYKVPGNLLGLARLQDAVAREARGKVGRMVVFSTQGFFDQTPGSNAFLTKFLRERRAAEAEVSV